ncbi:MAG TPA: hypothetical protein VIN58_24650 [Roseateles sp.]
MLSLLIASFGIATLVKAADGEVDMDLMQNIEDLHKSLSSNIALKDAKAGVAEARELAGMFTTVEQHFARKGDAEDAVAISRKSRDLAAQIADHLVKSDFEAATNAATAMGRACRDCHTFYKKS